MGRVKDTGYVNPQDVYNYLVVNKGLSREHALGMLANIQGESGFKISIQEYGKAAGTGGVGLYQHTGSRRTKLMQYTGGNISDWTKQVDFALQEADTKRYLAQTFKTPEEASIWFTTKWERPANAQQRAQERLKYLNNYSSFSGYESEYVPTTNTSTDQAEQTGGIPPQTVIPFEVVIAGQPVQANFSYEEFEKALLTVKKTEEKTEESPARQELEEQTTTQEEFLKAISSLSAPPASDDSAQGASQQQGFALGTGPYTPVEIPEMQGHLPQMPNLFSTQLPQMRDGGPTKTIDGVQYVQDEQGNWKYASGAPVTDRALAQRLQYEQSSTTQGAPKVTPATIRAQQVANQKNSPSLSQQKEYAQAQKAKKELELAQAKQQAYEQAIAKTKLQSVQPADWVFAAPALGLTAGADALSALGSLAATQIPRTGLSVGTAVNTAGGIHGATQFDDRVVDWQDVVAGDMDWKEAATKSFLTGVEVMGGYGAARQGFNTAKEIYAAGKGVNIYQARPVEMPVRPDLSYLGITPEQQDLLNLQQVNNTTMLTSDIASAKLKMLGEDYRSPNKLPLYMTPYQYPADQIARRFSPWQNSYFKTLEVEKAADRIIRRTTDDKVYYDLNGNIVKTPADNLQRGGKVSAQDTKEMVDGIAQILAQVNNAKNRSDIARNMIYDFEQEGLNYNLNKFLRDANVR
jgi:hypothetical protein